MPAHINEKHKREGVPLAFAEEFAISEVELKNLKLEKIVEENQSSKCQREDKDTGKGKKKAKY